MRVVPALRRQETQPTTERTSLTVLIPFRNEIARLPGLLDALARQEIPAGWQVNYFWINDHSTDGGDAFLREQISPKDHRLIDLPESRVGKKAALQAGLQESSAEWLLCTDADTLPGPGWIRQMVCWAVLKNWQFATGGVVLTGNAMVQRLQHWDMVAMMAITWLGWERGWWLLANGASLLLTREAAIRAGGWRQESLASGDDLFLVRRLHEQGYAGGFVADRSAFVRTPAMKSWSALLVQRKRWATKLRALPGWGIWVLGAFLLVVAWMPWLLMVAGIAWKPVLALAGCLLLGIKWFWDTWLLRMLGKITDRPISWVESLWLQPMHALLLLISAGYSIAGKQYQWKDRRVQ